jgi:DNA-directed RNA polymerase specialized sigma24 family protein
MNAFLSYREQLKDFFVRRLASGEAADRFLEDLSLDILPRSLHAAAQPVPLLYSMGNEFVVEGLRADLIREVAPPRGSAATDQAHRRRRRQAVLTALNELPAGPRQAFLLHRFGGFTLPEVACAMGLPLATVELRLVDALSHILRRAQ